MLGGLPTLGLPSKLQAPAHLVDQPPCSNRKGASLVKVVSFLSYFFAGVFLTNSIPHLVIAVTGRRHRTAFGENSSPVARCWSVLQTGESTSTQPTQKRGRFPMRWDVWPCRCSEYSMRGSPRARS